MVSIGIMGAGSADGAGLYGGKMAGGRRLGLMGSESRTEGKVVMGLLVCVAGRSGVG